MSVYVLQALVRVCCLRAFGYFISQLHTVTFTYDDTTATFCGPEPAATSTPNQPAEEKLVRCCLDEMKCTKFVAFPQISLKLANSDM